MSIINVTNSAKLTILQQNFEFYSENVKINEV